MTPGIICFEIMTNWCKHHIFKLMNTEILINQRIFLRTTEGENIIQRWRGLETWIDKTNRARAWRMDGRDVNTIQ